jgi:hypothetical protein
MEIYPDYEIYSSATERLRQFGRSKASALAINRALRNEAAVQAARPARASGPVKAGTRMGSREPLLDFSTAAREHA